MTASSGVAAKGVSFVWNEYPVAELTNISGPSSTSEEIDITNHDSPDNYREFVMGIIEGGKFEIEGNFVSTDANGQIALITDHYSRTARTARFNLLPTIAGTFTCTCTPETFSITSPAPGVLGFKASLKVAGKPVLYTTANAGLTTPFFALRDNGSNAVTPSPAASGTAYWYSATLDASDTGIAIQPTATAGTIKVNGAAVTSGAWSSDIAIAAGQTKLLYVEISEASKASKVYRIHVTRPSA